MISATLVSPRSPSAQLQKDTESVERIRKEKERRLKMKQEEEIAKAMQEKGSKNKPSRGGRTPRTPREAPMPSIGEGKRDGEGSS